MSISTISSIQFVSKGSNPNLPLDQSMKFLLVTALEYDLKFSETFSTFLQWNRHQISNSNILVSKKASMSIAGCKDKLSFLGKKPKNQLKTNKPLKREIKLESWEAPPKTKIYISLNYNIRLDDKQNLSSMIGPRSLDSVCPKGDYELFENVNKKLSFLNELPIISLNKLKFIIKKFQEIYGFSLNNMRTLAAFLNVNYMAVSYFWLNEAKNKFLHIKPTKRKIYTQKYLKFYCNICQIYACNFHFLCKDDYLADEDDVVGYNFYNNCFNIPKRQIYNQNYKDFTFSWVHSYRCPKNNGSTCFRSLDPSINIDNIENITLQKFEIELIKHCLNYNMINPCFIYLLFKNNDSYKKPCVVFFIYIIQNHLIKKRDEYLKNLKINVEIESKSITAQKKTSINLNKKALKTKIWNKNQEFMEYIPCFHEGYCNESNCYCIKNRGNCEKYCCCSSFCEYLIKGCNCIGGICNKNCECVTNQRECDPDYCERCCSKINKKKVEKSNLKIPTCLNSNMTYGVKKRLLIGKSKICNGLGVFAGEQFHKGDFIGEYVGEVLNFEEAEKRGRIYSLMNVYYLFTLNNNNIIDAYMYGNKCRFINHGSFGIDNATVKIMYCKGEHKIGIYSQKDIEIGDEILFDYGNKFKVPWLLEFNEKMRKKQKEKMRRKKDRKNEKEIELFDDKGEEYDDFIV